MMDERETIIRRAEQRQQFLGRTFYTAQEAAVLVGCSAKAVTNWCIRHKIGIKVGREYLVDAKKLFELQRRRASVEKSYGRLTNG